MSTEKKITNAAIDELQADLDGIKADISDPDITPEDKKDLEEAQKIIEANLLKEIDKEKKRIAKIAEKKASAPPPVNKPKVEVSFNGKPITETSVEELNKSWEERKIAVASFEGKQKTISPISKKYPEPATA